MSLIQKSMVSTTAAASAVEGRRRGRFWVLLPLLSSFLFYSVVYVESSSCVFTCGGSPARSREVGSCLSDCLPSNLCASGKSFSGLCLSSEGNGSVYLSLQGSLDAALSTGTSHCPGSVHTIFSLDSLKIKPGKLCLERCCDKEVTLAATAVDILLGSYELTADGTLGALLPETCDAATNLYYAFAGQSTVNGQDMNQSLVVLYKPQLAASCVYTLPTLVAAS